MKGNLKELSVIDLLSHFANERATGVLQFTYQKDEIMLDWIHGEIVNVVDRSDGHSGTLGELLLHIGEISQNQLDQAILQQKRSLSPLGLILQNLYGCEPERIRFVLRVQAIESLYSLMFWVEGEFHFVSKEMQPPRNSYVPIDVSNFLTEASPVIEAWPSILKYFPEPLLLVRRLSSEIPISQLDRLDELPRAVFDLLENESTYRELSILSGAGKFATGYALVQLLQFELIRLEDAKKDSIEFTRLFFGGRISHFLVWFLVSSLLVFGGIFLVAFAPYSPLRLLKPQYRYKVPDFHLYQRLDKWRRLRIKYALESYRHNKGVYPKTLEMLVKDGWILPSLIYFPGGNVYHYRRTQVNKYRLLAPAP